MYGGLLFLDFALLTMLAFDVSEAQRSIGRG